MRQRKTDRGGDKINREERQTDRDGDRQIRTEARFRDKEKKAERGRQRQRPS